MPESQQENCPITRSATALGRRSNRDWWPEQINLKLLDSGKSNLSLVDSGSSYKQKLANLDVDELKADLRAVITSSQPWWPADYGHYGPLFIRMAWHSAGTYRVSDGRGGASRGAQRFAPINSWPDNANLDKARRLLWPIKQRWGARISWADLIVFAGNVALEIMGLDTVGFAFGREDIWEADEVTYWGPEDTWLGDERYSKDHQLKEPLGAVQMGLIYVNPEGPSGNPDPKAAAVDVRETFARMAMDDYETVALIVGGHTFGKTHGAVSSDCVGPAPEGAPLEEQGLGWRNHAGTGAGSDTYTSGLEGAWTNNPISWDNGFLDNLFRYDWVLAKSPAGAYQWTPRQEEASQSVVDAHDPSKRHAPIMLTTDLALKEDPTYEKIARHFYENPDELKDAFAKAWFKLIHRDMGPKTRYLGPLVPGESFIWQDPVPTPCYRTVGEREIAELKSELVSLLSVSDLVATAWSSASTYRGTDRRGGANGARVALSPQRRWEVNQPERLEWVLGTLRDLQSRFNQRAKDDMAVSLADLIVLGGCAGVEEAARRAGIDVVVPFRPGRGDASQEQTDEASFDCLEPRADGFINYRRPGEKLPAEHLLVERASLLTLSAQEMTVLVGGLRVLGANFQGSLLGVLTERREVLSNDFFVNLLDMGTYWKISEEDGIYYGLSRSDGSPKWKASAVDLVFGSNAQLRAITEIYASYDSEGRFAHDFIEVWDKVMNLDRFDLD
ncbi:catalase-peroxidase [Ferrithrix thermotolerans DSM 19514]|uniref:Catalase-peroxidase n=1 Tax=Ferrithrix thermotolerans DSM 19514 TaxID=1121881 RepID=A0A1M4V343_9ACTN|nr:catalase/peroxidase HPI [Ferrithrix thermotolerans]SHE63414.1 catalase-peroxidase [Ferrithrix thermotolerans DSM 19514]